MLKISKDKPLVNMFKIESESNNYKKNFKANWWFLSTIYRLDREMQTRKQELCLYVLMLGMMYNDPKVQFSNENHIHLNEFVN